VSGVDDALRPAPDASYEAQRARPDLDGGEQRVAAAMIGRPLRGESAAAVRCAWGLPAVLRVSPRLDDGTPFPTTFWLACPIASSLVGRLEGEGAMVGLNQRLADDPATAEAYAGAHRRYLEMRDAFGAPLPRPDVSAGGMPDRVKCLHAVYAHHLATRDNPLGAWVADRVEPMPCPHPCVDVEALRPPQSE